MNKGDCHTRSPPIRSDKPYFKMVGADYFFLGIKLQEARCRFPAALVIAEHDGIDMRIIAQYVANVAKQTSTI